MTVNEEVGGREKERERELEHKFQRLIKSAGKQQHARKERTNGNTTTTSNNNNNKKLRYSVARSHIDLA